MARPQMEVRTYAAELVAELLGFCKRECETHPEDVLLLGLGYAVCLNEHQIRYARLLSLPERLLEHPFDRSPVRVADSRRAAVDMNIPSWLGTAAAAYAESAPNLADRPLLFAPRGLGGFVCVPATAAALRTRVQKAGLLATGKRLSLHRLNLTGILDARDRGHMYVANSVGYAPSYAIRLATARRVPEWPAG